MGLTPDEVLDMEYWMFRCYMLGYEERTSFMSTLSVYNGYWAGYYNNTKHAKKPDVIIKHLLQKKENKKHKKDRPDVDLFMERERRRLAYEASKNK